MWSLHNSYAHSNSLSMSTIISKDIQSLVQADKINDNYTVKRKLLWGPDGTGNDITNSTPLPTSDATSQTSLTQIDTDLNTFSGRNHTDLTAINANLTVINAQFSNSSTPTITRVSSSVTSVQLLGVNTNRLGAIFINDSTSACYLKFGTTASATSYTFYMSSGATLILEKFPIYTGRIDAIWSTANGAMQVTELTS